MKKAFAFLTAAAAALCMNAVGSANSGGDRSDYFTYLPEWYFVSNGDEYQHYLKNGTVYINTKDLPEEGTHIYTDVYFYDKYKIMKCIEMQIAYDNDEIELCKPISVCEELGKVYQGQDKCLYMYLKEPFVDDKGENHPYHYVQAVWVDMSTDPIEVLTENTDDYPLLRLDSLVKKSSAPGHYVLYIHDSIGRKSMMDFIYVERRKTYRTFTPGPYTKPQQVILSDRELGDVDRNGVINAEDAQCVLNMCTNRANNYNDVVSYEEGRFCAADVNGDGLADADDASIIMDYVLEGNGMSFYDYIAE